MKPKHRTKKKLSKKPQYDFIKGSGLLDPSYFFKALKEVRGSKKK